MRQRLIPLILQRLHLSLWQQHYQMFLLNPGFICWEPWREQVAIFWIIAWKSNCTFSFIAIIFFFFFFLKNVPHMMLWAQMWGCSRPWNTMEGPAPWNFGAEMAGIQQAGSVGGQEKAQGKLLWDSWHFLCSFFVVPWAGGTSGLAWEVESKLTSVCSSAMSGEHKFLGEKMSFKCLNKSWVDFNFGKSVHLGTQRYGEAPRGILLPVDKELLQGTVFEGLVAVSKSCLTPRFPSLSTSRGNNPKSTPSNY